MLLAKIHREQMSIVSKAWFTDMPTRWGIFRLTNPPGMPEILACNKPGIFHTHTSDSIYTDALRPGHVYEASDMDFDIVDLRRT